MYVQSPEMVPAIVSHGAPPSLLTNVHMAPWAVRFLSASHFSAALTIIVLQITATCITATHSDSNSVDRIYSSSSTGVGIWCGVFFAGTGVVGTLTSRRKTNCHLISFLTLSVLCVIPFCAFALAAASHDLAERYYLFCNHRFSSSSPSDGADVVPCSRHYGTMVWLNALLLVCSSFEVVVAVASVVVSSRALHRGRGCGCCCGGCYDSDAADHSALSSSPPAPSFVIYTRGNLVDSGGAANRVPSAPHALLALPPNGVHPQYFSFHAPDVSESPFHLAGASLDLTGAPLDLTGAPLDLTGASLDLTGARYTADEISSRSPALAVAEVSNGDSDLLVDGGGRLPCSRSPPPSYEESVKR